MECDYNKHYYILSQKYGLLTCTVLYILIKELIGNLSGTLHSTAQPS